MYSENQEEDQNNSQPSDGPVIRVFLDTITLYSFIIQYSNPLDCSKAESMQGLSSPEPGGRHELESTVRRACYSCLPRHYNCNL